MTTTISRSVLVAAVVAIVALVTAAVLFVTGDDSMQRLAILVGFVAPISVGLVAAIRSDAAAKATDSASNIAQALNGSFEARVRHSVREVAGETGTYTDTARAAADAAKAAAVEDPNNTHEQTPTT